MGVERRDTKRRRKNRSHIIRKNKERRKGRAENEGREMRRIPAISATSGLEARNMVV